MNTKYINEKTEINILKKLMRTTKNKRMYVRYQVIVLHKRGYTNVHIASIVGLAAHTIGIYIKSYKVNGIEGLKMGKTTGTPRFLNKEQENELYEIITTKTPDEVGFGYRKNWNANIVRKLVLDRFNVNYSNRGMLQVLHRLNFSYTRPTYTLAKADPAKQEEYKKEFEVLKKVN